jgi:hypothetical protein
VLRREFEFLVKITRDLEGFAGRRMGWGTVVWVLAGLGGWASRL